MEPQRNREYAWYEGLALCLAAIGTQLSSEVMNQWGIYFYSPSEGVGRTIYVAVGIVGWIFIIGTLWDAVTDPAVGLWSDRTKTRSRWFRLLRPEGRRRPFIFWGSILMTFTAIGFWYPPVEGPSTANFIYGTVLLCLHWTMFTITVVPLISLAPEIARSERARVSLGTWTAVGMIVGLFLAAVLPGALIKHLDPARVEDTFSAIGYRRVAWIFALISLALFQLPVWLIKERYDSDAPAQKAAPWRERVLAVVYNRPFVVYVAAFFLFTTGFLAAQRALPYWAELGLGGDEETVTYLMIPFILTALASYAVIPFAARRLHVKWMLFVAFLIIASGMPWMYVLGKAEIGTMAKTLLGGALFAYCGVGQGIMYVMMTPAMGEIIDYDEQRSGQRREALYNGLTGFSWKASMGCSIFIATQSMHLWGNAPGHSDGVLLVGPIAGVFGVLGLCVMLFYPVLHVAREHPPAAPGL